MICALVDYVNYRRRSGRFAWGVGHSVMAAGWAGELPPVVLDAMKPGDGLLFQWFNNWTSWGIMYVTSSEISHVGIYVGDGRILHMTTSGVRIEPLTAMFSSDIRILPFSFPEAPEKSTALSEEAIARYVREGENAAYPWRTTILYGLRIVSGRPWPRYRFRFFVDVLILSLTIDACTRFFITWPFVVTATYCMIVVWNRIVWQFWPQAIEDADAKRGAPGDASVVIPYMGGGFLFDPRALEDALRRGGRIASGLPGWSSPRNWKSRLRFWHTFRGLR